MIRLRRLPFAPWLRRFVLLPAALVLGYAYSRVLMGPHPLDPRDLTWLKGDPLEHYLGWLFFTQTPHWSFPLTWSDRLGYPVGGYLSLIDPALLMTFGLLRPLIPADAQYLGLFYAINAGLQFHWGVRLTARLAPGDRVAAGLGGLMFLLSPIMAQKALGHFSGGCHWPILAALFFLLRAGGPGPDTIRRLGWMAPLWGLIVVSAVIHPYLGLSVCMIAMAALVAPVIDRRLSGGAAFPLLLGCPLVYAGALSAIGILSVGGGAAAAGFADYSLNLLAPFNPTPYPSLLPLGMAVFDLQDYEGYAYLGLGTLGLLLILAVRPRATLFAWTRGIRVALALLVLGCLLIAISNRVTIGRHVVFSYTLPHGLAFAASAFRAPARFIWPAYYLLIGVAVAGVARRFSRNARCLLLVVAVIVQFVDLAGLRATVRHAHDTPTTDPDFLPEWRAAWPGPSPQWTMLGHDHAHLVVLPAWQCDRGDSPGGERGYAIFGRLAATLDMTLNEYRASRYAPASLAVHCETLPAQIARGELRTDTAYVLNDYLFLALSAQDGGAHGGARCQAIDGYTLCLAGDPPVTDWRTIVAPVEAGQSIGFARGDRGRGWLSPDWQRAETWGTWSGRTDAALILPVGASRPLDLTITLHPLLTEQRPVQPVRLSSAGRQIAAWSLGWDAEQHPRRVHIPAELIPPDGLLPLVLSVDQVATLRQLGYAEDDRPLGVGLVGIAVDAP